MGGIVPKSALMKFLAKVHPEMAAKIEAKGISKHMAAQDIPLAAQAAERDAAEAARASKRHDNSAEVAASRASWDAEKAAKAEQAARDNDAYEKLLARLSRRGE